ncbi:MAG: hypothetical protein ABIE74_01860 [Pseudomonadota bacterium]
MKSKPVDTTVRNINPESVQQAAADKDRRDKTVDAVRDALNLRVVREAGDLKGLVNEGGARLSHMKLRAKVRAKVSQKIDPIFADHDIVEEVTERLTEAAENDPYYRKLFSSEE